MSNNDKLKKELNALLLGKLEEIKKSINITFAKEINIDSLKKYSWKNPPAELLELPEGITAIYIIKSGKELDYESLKKERDEFSDDKYQMARPIGKNSETKHCLYVGQSKNVINRLKEHLFLSRKTTYALRLHKFNLLKNSSISISVYGFDNKSDEVQVFEDLLWDEYKPLFGRRGAK